MVVIFDSLDVFQVVDRGGSISGLYLLYLFIGKHYFWHMLYHNFIPMRRADPQLSLLRLHPLSDAPQSQLSTRAMDH